MRINRRIVLSFTALGAGVSMACFVALIPTRSRVTSAGDVHAPALHAIQGIEAGVRSAVEESFAYLVSGQEVGREEFQHWADGFDEQAERFAVMAHLDRPEEQQEAALFERIRQEQRRLVERASVMFSEYAATGSVRQTTFTAYEASIDSLASDIEEFVVIERAEIDQAHGLAMTTLRSAAWTIGLIGVFHAATRIRQWPAHGPAAAGPSR